VALPLAVLLTVLATLFVLLVVLLALLLCRSHWVLPFGSSRGARCRFEQQ